MTQDAETPENTTTNFLEQSYRYGNRNTGNGTGILVKEQENRYRNRNTGTETGIQVRKQAYKYGDLNTGPETVIQARNKNTRRGAWGTVRKQAEAQSSREGNTSWVRKYGTVKIQVQ